MLILSYQRAAQTVLNPPKARLLGLFSAPRDVRQLAGTATSGTAAVRIWYGKTGLRSLAFICGKNPGSGGL